MSRADVSYTDELVQHGVIAVGTVWDGIPDDITAWQTGFSARMAATYDLSTVTAVLRPKQLIVTPLSTTIPLPNREYSLYIANLTEPELIDDINASTYTNLLDDAVNRVSYVIGDEGTDLVIDQPFTFELGQSYDHGTWTVDGTMNANLSNYWALNQRRSEWNGRLVLILVDPNFSPVPIRWYSQPEAQALGNTAFLPTLVVDQWNQNTGHDIGGTGRPSRATFCARSNLPLQTDQLVEDGYLEGLWVHPDWYEPEDTVGDFIDPPASERDIDEPYGVDS